MNSFGYCANGVMLALATFMTACELGSDEEPRSESPVVSGSQSTVVGCCGAGSDPNIDGLRLSAALFSALPGGSINSYSLRLIPYVSSTISLFDGSTWVTREAGDPLPEAQTPGTPNAVYDVFAYWNGTNVALELIPWPNSTGNGTTLSFQDGVQVKENDARRRYVGVAATTANGTFQDSVDTRYVWNRYNQAPRPIWIRGTGTWLYNSPGSTFRSANNGQLGTVKVVVGRVDTFTFPNLGSHISVQAQVMGYPTSGTGWVAAGIGVGNNTNRAQVGDLAAASSGQYGHATAFYDDYLSGGLTEIFWLETGSGSAQYFFLGAAFSPNFGNTGLTGSITM